MCIRKLKANEIECRVAQCTAKGCSLLLYKTARVDRAILDEYYDDLWQNDFKVIDGKMYGGIGIYNKDLNQWLWRWDCGTESNTEAEKGQASDCFKRAGFKWGIGVELYTAPFIWVKEGDVIIQLVNNKYKTNDKFAVTKIDYNDIREINRLQIINCKTRKIVFDIDRSIVKDDTDIYLGLEAVDNTANALKYFREYENEVNDKKAFKEAYKKRYLTLKKKEENDD